MILKVEEKKIDLGVGLIEGEHTVREKAEWVNIVDSCLERVITEIPATWICEKNDTTQEIEFHTILHFENNIDIEFVPFGNTADNDKLIDYLLTL